MPSTSNVFYDVAQGAWYYDAVQYVTQSGLMTGGVRQTVRPKYDSVPGPGGPDPVCPGGGAYCICVQ